MYYIGVDLGGTNIAAGIVDGDNGKIVVKGSVPTLAEREGEEIVKDMAALCEKLVADANLTKADIASVGIAAPGSADCEGGIIIYANNLRFYDFHIADIFRIYNLDTEIIAASVRNPIHVTDCALAGAHIATVPYSVIEQMKRLKEIIELEEIKFVKNVKLYVIIIKNRKGVKYVNVLF